jgi:hypothetical protein
MPLSAGKRVYAVNRPVAQSLPGAPFLARPVREKWGVKHPRDARIHLFLFDEFLPVGPRDAFPQ